MDRRTFLGVAAGAGLSTAAFASGGPRAKVSIGVVGGGILGASIAMHCAQAGAAVTLFEKTAPASGATSKSFAWINPFVDDPHYMALRLESLKRWQALDKPLGMNAIWGDYVGFTDNPADRGRMAIQSRELAAAGYPTRSLDAAALKQVSPEVDPGNLVEATFSSLGGHVDPVYATQRYLAAATAAGARILYPCPITAIEPSNGMSGVAVITPNGRQHFDHLIIVAGVDAPPLLAPLGYTLPLQYSPGALVHSKPLPIMTRHVYDGPGPLEWKQMANGSVVGLDASTPPHIPAHAGILAHPMEYPPGIAEMHGLRILGKFAAYVPALVNAEFGFMTIGFRPMPTDGLPIVGAVPGVPGVSLCVTHSGVTLAAVLGAYMASEIMTGQAQPLLAPYRPARALPSPKPA